METSKKEALFKYLTKLTMTLFFGSVCIIFVIFSRDYFSQTDKQIQYRILADAFTIPGVIFSLWTPLIWLIDEGSLSGISYALKKFVSHLIPFNNTRDMTYAEYVEGRKKHSGYSYFLVAGLIYLFIGIIFTVLYF